MMTTMLAGGRLSCAAVTVAAAIGNSAKVDEDAAAAAAVDQGSRELLPRPRLRDLRMTKLPLPLGMLVVVKLMK